MKLVIGQFYFYASPKMRVERVKLLTDIHRVTKKHSIRLIMSQYSTYTLAERLFDNEQEAKQYLQDRLRERIAKATADITRCNLQIDKLDRDYK